MFNGPLLDELGSVTCFFPHLGVCDPHSGPLIGYEHPTRGYHCFEPKFCAKILLTSDYTVFPKTKTMFYRVSDVLDRPIYAVGFNEVQLNMDTFLMYPNESITDSLDSPIPPPGFDNCYSGDGGWMFHHVQINPDGEAIFYLGDTMLSLEKPGADQFRVLTRAGLNESWIAMESFLPEGGDLVITATITDIFEMQVLGSMDTVKQISLSSPHLAIDHLSILLGKRTGLVQAINFRQIRNPQSISPNPYDHQGNYTLVGAKGNVDGVRNLTWEDVWRFNVGDILHIHSFIVTAGTGLNTQITDIIWEVLDAHSGDMITYEIDEQKRVISGSNGSSVVLTRDTIVAQYHRYMSQFDLIPGTRFVDEPFGSYQQGLFNGRNTKCTDQMASFFYDNHGCYKESIVDGCFDCVQYIEGLGGGYYDCFGITSREFRGLRYYKKGKEEWGTPFDFTVGIQNTQVSGNFTVYPNPAENTLHISTTGKGPLMIQIYDVNGTLRMSRTLQTENSTVDIHQLPDGMYFIHGVEKTGQRYALRFVVHRKGD